MNRRRIILLACTVFLSVLSGAIVGGIAGNPCEFCSADVDRIFIGAQTTGGLILATGIYQAWQRQWTHVVALALILLPAAYFSSILAQEVGLWWDHL